MRPIILATIPLIASITVYAMVCWTVPFRRHFACRGTGTRRTLILRRWRPCRGCKGSGLVLRLGRRIFNYLAATYRDGHTTGGTR